MRSVIIGSRDAAKAIDAASKANELLAQDSVCGADNVAAATSAEIIVLTV